MVAVVIRRMLEALATLVAATLVVFLVGRLTGDPAKLLVSLEKTTNLQEQQLREELGLNRPLWAQYGLFVAGAARGDLGRSFYSGQPVTDAIRARLWPSLSLATVSLAVGLVLAVPLGLAAGLARGSILDRVVTAIAVAGQAMPSFWLGLVLVVLVSVKLGWLPAAGAGGWRHYVLPAFTLGWFISSGLVRLLRSSVIDIMESDYIRFARSFGMPQWRLVLVWALRNALIPLVAFIGFMFSIIVAGAVVVEVVFAWPGLGRLAYDSVLARDFPTLQGVVVVWAAVVIVASLAADLLQTLLDPRIRT